MAKALFILGLPGSGKSTVARFITELLLKAGLIVIYRNDFEILNQMYENDRDGLFKHPEDGDPGVFDVRNIGAFNIALKRLEEVVREAINKYGQEAFYIIEFSRNDYELAFSLFDDSGLLADAHYIHLDTTVEKCQERIRQRATDPACENDYPVSDYIFKEYYHSDDGKFLPEILIPYGVDVSHAYTIPNNGDFEVIAPRVIEAVSLMFDQGSDVRRLLEQEQGVPALI